MDSISILPTILDGKDEDTNKRIMNASLMSLISTSSYCDCQSQPLSKYYASLYQSARFAISGAIDKYLMGKMGNLKNPGKFLKYVENTPYANTLQERAEVPEGLCVTYLEYLDVLIPAQERANAVLTTVIRPFTKYCAKIVTDVTFRNSVRHSIKEYTDLEASHKLIVDELGKCFSKNRYGADASFSQVVRRAGDWPEVFKKTDQLKKLYDVYDQKAVTQGLNELYEVVDKLVEVINTDGMSKAEAEVTKLLGSGIYSVAREIEFTAHTTFRTQTLLKAIDETVSGLEKKKKL